MREALTMIWEGFVEGLEITLWWGGMLLGFAAVGTMVLGVVFAIYVVVS